jgi:uncharacterized protein (TIGR02246 family)
MTKLIVILPMILLVAACGQSASSSDPTEISARSAEWDSAMNARDIDALAALYTDDARLLAPNAAMSVGQDSIRAAFGGMIDVGLKVKLTSIEMRVSGDIGHNVGQYVLSAAGKAIDNGKFVETWERGADGAWRISNDIYNSDRPVDEPNALLMIVHEVDNAEHWLAAWRGEDSRHSLFADNGAARVQTFRSVDNPHLTGLVISVNDMGALQDMLESDDGIAAAKADGVRMQSLRVLREAD